MSLGGEERFRPCLGFPRVSGDEPVGGLLRIPASKFSPRERG